MPTEIEQRIYDRCIVRVGNLEAENAKLRERIGELEELTDDERYIPQEWYAQLKAENAKLCEFATETWELLTCNEPVFVWKGLQELARNLGIEVDG